MSTNQIGSAFFITLLASMLRMLNPIKKGQALTAVIVLYVLCGGVGGYVSARLYKFCDAKSWKRATIATAIAFPGLVVSMFMVLNVFLTIVGAATAVSFLTIIMVFLMWGCVSTPLVFVGSYFGYRADKIEVPTKTNQMLAPANAECKQPRENSLTSRKWMMSGHTSCVARMAAASISTEMCRTGVRPNRSRARRPASIPPKREMYANPSMAVDGS